MHSGNLFTFNKCDSTYFTTQHPVGATFGPQAANWVLMRYQLNCQEKMFAGNQKNVVWVYKYIDY